MRGRFALFAADPVGMEFALDWSTHSSLPVVGRSAGFGDLREVELLVEAGFTPLEAIKIATPNGAKFLFLADRAASERVDSFARCFELFDGRDDAAVTESRTRWKAYKAAGHTVVYWQQTATGGWEKKA